METKRMFSENEARGILTPYHRVFERIVRVAWRRWRDISNRFDDPYKRTRATIVYQFMAEEAKREFENHFDVHVIEENESILISLHNKLAVRLKKLNDGLRSSNYPTPRQLEFAAQLPLPGIPDCERVVVGYVPDSLGMDIDIHVVYGQGDEKIWSYELDKSFVPELSVIENPATQEEVSVWTFARKSGEDVTSNHFKS